VLADPDKLHRGQQFSFLRVAAKKKMRTDKLFSLHSFITVTWFVVDTLLILPATLKEIRNVARPQGFINQGKRLRGSASFIRLWRMKDQASQAVS